jgi:hypothetical protein
MFRLNRFAGRIAGLAVLLLAITGCPTSEDQTPLRSERDFSFSIAGNTGVVTQSQDAVNMAPNLSIHLSMTPVQKLVICMHPALTQVRAHTF